MPKFRVDNQTVTPPFEKVRATPLAMDPVAAGTTAFLDGTNIATALTRIVMI